MDLLPPAEQDSWARTLHDVNADIRAGVVAATQATRDRYWRHWTQFLPSNFNPYLQNLAEAQRLVVLQIFARRVREGKCGRGQQVQTGSVQTALGAVGKTIELAGFPNPLYRPGTTNYHASIALQMETYKRSDPATQPQVAVPVAIPNYIYRHTRATNDRRLRAAGDLTLIAFYFLLRVGEYTHHGSGKRRTQQFRLCDIKFFANGQEIKPNQLPTHGDHINLVSLTINNQKNGKRGETLSHHALTNGNECCPVRAVVARARDMVRDGASADTLICAFRETLTSPWQQVRGSDIVGLVKDAVRLNPDECNGFIIDNIGSHSLRAGGAMAMFLSKRDTIAIQKAGRWTSTTFLDYIHNQIDVVTRGLSQSMSTAIPFINMTR